MQEAEIRRKSPICDHTFIKNVAMLNFEQLSSCENGRTASGINVGFSGSAYLAL